MRWLADCVYLLAGLAYRPVAVYQALIVGKNRHGRGQRFGAVRPPDPTSPTGQAFAKFLAMYDGPRGTPQAIGANV